MTDVNFVCMGKAGPKLKPGIEFYEKIGYKKKLPESLYAELSSNLFCHLQLCTLGAADLRMRLVKAELRSCK